MRPASRFARIMAVLALHTVSFSPAVAAEQESDSTSIFELERYFTAPQSQKVDPPLQVGDVIRFRWIGEKKPGANAVRVGLPSGSKPQLSEQGWEVYSHPKDDATSAFSVIPIKSGALTLPSLQIEDADGKVLGRTRELQFEISSTGDPGQKPADYVPPLSMGFPRGWAYALGAALLLAVAGAVMWWRRRRAASTSSEVGLRPRLSEHDEAMVLFDELEKAALIAQQQYKRHYFGISEILKQYIERRYGFHALEQTTSEMMAGLEAAGVGRESVELLVSLFGRLDRVKFTDFVPPSGDAEPAELLQDARAWVQRTRQRVPAPATGGLRAP
jgi:hypothetical protein